MAGADSPGLPVQHTLRVSLRGGKDNVTYRGTLLIRNWTSILADDADPAPEDAATTGSELEDPTGASYYVIAVVLVYGFSIVMLIASHIKRKHQKVVEDRQINKYLQEFMVVQEKSSRDSYRHLKRSIIAKLYKDKSHTSKHLSKAIFPMMAIALPASMANQDSSESLSHRRYSMGSRRSVASIRLPAYRSLDEGGISSGEEVESYRQSPSQDESGTSTPQQDCSMEPFEGVDPALSFPEEGSEAEGGEGGEEDTAQDSCAASQASTTESSSVFHPEPTTTTITTCTTAKPTLSHSHSDSIPLGSNSLLGLPHADSPTPRKVSWSDDRTDSLITSIHEVDDGALQPEARPASPDGDVHNIHKPSPTKAALAGRDRSPDTSPWSSRSSSLVSAAGASRKTPTDGQFDLAAALLRHKRAYKPPPQPKPSVARPASSPAAIKPPPPPIGGHGGRLHRQPTPTVSIQRAKQPQDGGVQANGPQGQQEGGESKEGVWLVNEQSTRTHNGLMREEDPELYSLRHGHGMGSRSPLIKERLSPVTPPSPHYGARLTPQPLLTPPPRASRINPFFFSRGSSSSREQQQPSPGSSPGHSPSPPRRLLHANGGGSPSLTSPTSPPPGSRGASPPGAGGKDTEQESLLHITCV